MRATSLSLTVEPSGLRRTTMSPNSSALTRRPCARTVYVNCWFRGPGSAPTRNQQFKYRSEEHTSELQSHLNLVCRLLLEKKKKNKQVTVYMSAHTPRPYALSLI